MRAPAILAVTVQDDDKGALVAMSYATYVNLAALPEKMFLEPVKLVPLPQHYKFAVRWAPGWHPPQRDNIGLVVDNELLGRIGKQDEPGDHGFNTLLERVLIYGRNHNQWAATVQCAVVAMNGSVYVAKSNSQPLCLPVRPLADIAINQFVWNAITGDTPSPLALPSPSGRRLYRRAALGGGFGPLALPKLWYVKPDNTLEDTVSGRGFDRLTFWQAVFGMSLKSTTNLVFEHVMAKLLNAHVAPPVPAVGKLSALVATQPSPFGTLANGLMWTPTRFVCVFLHGPNSPFAMEFDATGFHSKPLQGWLASENPDTVWNYRRLKSPTPLPAAGLLSLP